MHGHNDRDQRYLSELGQPSSSLVVEFVTLDPSSIVGIVGGGGVYAGAWQAGNRRWKQLGQAPQKFPHATGQGCPTNPQPSHVMYAWIPPLTVQVRRRSFMSLDHRCHLSQRANASAFRFRRPRVLITGVAGPVKPTTTTQCVAAMGEHQAAGAPGTVGAFLFCC